MGSNPSIYPKIKFLRSNLLNSIFKKTLNIQIFNTNICHNKYLLHFFFLFLQKIFFFKQKLPLLNNFIFLIINQNSKNLKFFFLLKKSNFFLSSNQIFNQLINQTDLKSYSLNNINKKSIKFFKIVFLFILKSLLKLKTNLNNKNLFINIKKKNFIFFFNIFSLLNIFFSSFKYTYLFWTLQSSKFNFFKRKKSIKRKLKKNFIYNSVLF